MDIGISNNSEQKTSINSNSLPPTEIDEEDPPPVDKRSLGDVPSMFLKAAENGDLVTLESLLLQNPNLIQFEDDDGYTALHRAAYSDASPTVVKYLIDQGASVSSRTNDGWTPIHSAAKWNSFQALQVLLQNGGDPNSKSNGGQTPLHLASETSKSIESLVMLLLHPSINIFIENSAGDKPIDIARRSGPHAHFFDLAKDSINKF